MQQVIRHWRWIVGGLVVALLVGVTIWLSIPQDDPTPTQTTPTFERPDLDQLGSDELDDSLGLDGGAFDALLSAQSQGGKVKVTVSITLSGNYAGYAYLFRGGEVATGKGATFSSTSTVSGRPAGLIAGAIYPGGTATCSVSINGQVANSNSATAAGEGRWVYCMA